VKHVKKELGFSERRICKVVKLHRSSMRYQPVNREFQSKLRARVISITSEYGRYGYRHVTGMLDMEGWDVGKDRVFTIWRKEELKVPQKQPKRARLWLADRSCIRQRPEHVNNVWPYDFVSEQTHDGRKVKILNVVDEFSRERLLSLVARRIRSDNGPEFIATKLREWLG
jgi:transposase InsO family protein